MEFFVDVSEVRANSLNAKEQLVGDFFVVVTLGEVREDFHFPTRKILRLF